MKKILVLFALAVIVAAQMSFIISFQSASTFYDVTGTSAVVISKMNYASVRASIIIFHVPANPAPVLIFPNGTRQELTTDFYSMDVFLPRTGDFIGDHDLKTMYGDHLEYSSSYEGQLLVLTRDHPTDVDIVSDVGGDFLNWYSLTNNDDDDFLDIFWFKIQGEAHVSVFIRGFVI